jgi:hypothetical protein
VHKKFIKTVATELCPAPSRLSSLYELFMGSLRMVLSNQDSWIVSRGRNDNFHACGVGLPGIDVFAAVSLTDFHPALTLGPVLEPLAGSRPLLRSS